MPIGILGECQGLGEPWAEPSAKGFRIGKGEAICQGMDPGEREVGVGLGGGVIEHAADGVGLVLAPDHLDQIDRERGEPVVGGAIGGWGFLRIDGEERLEDIDGA